MRSSFVRVIAALSLTALLTASAVATDGMSARAAGTATVQGVLTPSTMDGWDGLATVELRSTTGPKYSTTIDPATGAYTIDVPYGNYYFFIDYTGTGNFLDRFGSSDDADSTSQGFYGLSAASYALSFTVYQGAVVTGTVSGSGGVILDAPEVRAFKQTSYVLNTPRVSVDASTGEYRIDRIEKGVYRIEFRGGSSWFPKNESRSLLQASSSEINAALEPGTSISGTVTMPAGSGPVPVRLYRDGAQVDWTQTYGDYSFAVPPGTYTVGFGYNSAGARLRDEWWHGVRTEAEATPIVVSVGHPATGINATMDVVAGLRGYVWFEYFDGGQQWYMDHWATLLKESPVGSGEWVEVGSDFIGYTGTYDFPSVEPGKYKIRVEGDANLLIRSTYWPSTEYFAQSGTITVREEDAGYLPNKDVTMVSRSAYVDRIQGPDRYSTAVETTKFGFDAEDTPVDVVYIASGANYPDALAAGPAAIHNNGALLMVKPDSVPAPVMAELRRLDPQRIVIAGSTAAVSASVEATLVAEFGRDVVERIGGANRYETARRIIADAFDSADVAFIATGNNFPDALAAGPAAATVGAPVILVNGFAGGIDAPTAQLLRDLGVTQTYILGSTAAVGAGIEQGIYDVVGSYPVRLQGPSRYDTALAIVQEFFDDSYYSFLATGTNFPDALGGGALAGRLGAPLYLTPPHCLLTPVLIDILYVDTREVLLLGSSAALSDAVASGTPCG